jgi:phosphoglycolate phosphatase-like HAD superfamily hydrolase
VAQGRAIAKYDVSFHRANTVLVGDTPRDVRAGREGGARVVAVASGLDSVEALRAEGADVVLPDLRDTRAVVDAVRDGPLSLGMLVVRKDRASLSLIASR